MLNFVQLKLNSLWVALRVRISKNGRKKELTVHNLQMSTKMLRSSRDVSMYLRYLKLAPFNAPNSFSLSCNYTFKFERTITDIFLSLFQSQMTQTAVAEIETEMEAIIEGQEQTSTLGNWTS